MEENRCSECVGLGLESTALDHKCNVVGPSRLARELVEKRKELWEELEKSAKLQAKIACLSKIVKSLESRAKEETEEMMRELEAEKSPEDHGDPSASLSSNEGME